MIYFEAISQVSNACAALVCVRDNDDLVATIDEFGRELIDVTLDPPRLREEEVAHHGDIIRHVEGLLQRPSSTEHNCVRMN